MRKLAPILLTLSLTVPVSGCGDPPVVVKAVDLLCTETSRYHTTDEQRAAVKKDPATWYGLFQWLSSFDEVRDKKKCAD